MKIVSLNISAGQTIRFNEADVATGIDKRPVAGPIAVTRLGLADDTIVDRSVHGGVDQAVYLYFTEDYEWWAAQLGRPLEYGTFGENMTVAGSDGVPLVIGDRLRIGEVLLEISAPRAPCFKLGVRMGDSRFVKQFVKACRPGAYARVIAEGTLRPGDTVEIERTSADHATVDEVFRLWHSPDKSRELIDKALRSPLASVHRGMLEKWRAQAG